MSRDIQQVVLASNNLGKLNEFQHLLGGLNFKMLPQKQFGIQAVEETGLTFIENAILKARHASRIAELPALADDSGLEVDILDGAPGIYSARFSGEDASDADNNQKLLQLLEGKFPSERTARFHCVLVYLRHAEDPTPLVIPQPIKTPCGNKIQNARKKCEERQEARYQDYSTRRDVPGMCYETSRKDHAGPSPPIE